MKDKTLKILLVDDHKIVTEGISVLLTATLDCTIVGQVHSGIDAVEFVKVNDVDVIFMDIVMPGRVNGLGATSMIREYNTNVRIIVLTMLSDAATIRKIFQAGANGFTIKNSSSVELLNAIDVVMTDQIYIHPELKGKFRVGISNSSLIEFKLTEIEYGILKKLVEGKTTKEIASENFRSTETIKSHRRRIMKKLNCKNIVELVRVVIHNRIVEI